MQEFTLIRNIRSRFLKELEEHSLEELNFIPSSHRNNILWNIGHSVVTQELLCYSLSGFHCNMDKELLKLYKIGTAPDGKATQKDVDVVKHWLVESVDLLEKDYNAGRFQEFKEYTVGFGTHLTCVEDAIRFNPIHEGLHYGYLLAIKKLL